MSTQEPVRPTHLIFDLGGVIVELDGLPIDPEWLDEPLTPEQSWQRWLTSPVPKAFETGQLSVEEFAERMVGYHRLSISANRFRAHFERWPIGTFPGALELLDAAKARYRTAVFSNSNALHWPRKMGEMGLAARFHHFYASHLIGRAKPDAEAFELVIADLGVPPEVMLFFDDNAMNVQSAQQLGMQAEQVSGIDELHQALQRRGLL